MQDRDDLLVPVPLLHVPSLSKELELSFYLVPFSGSRSDPLDIEALASAMAAALSDVGLGARLAAQGLERVAVFSWQETNLIILDAYRKAA